MRVRASFKGHPVHPMLIPFPFAFLTGALVFDLLGQWLGTMELSYTGRHLTIAGLAAGVAAAVPGAIDYFGSVPPESSAKRRATTHALLNLGALALFAIAYALRTDGEASPGTIALELAGAGVLAVSGYMGGTLVYRNQMGVDHRYAGAGKWQELSADDRAGWVAAGRSGDLGINQMRLVRLGRRRLVVGRTEDGLRAFDDRCTHRGGPLSDGVLICGRVQCPWHGSQFDVANGAVACGPATRRIAAYPVEEQDGLVRLRR